MKLKYELLFSNNALDGIVKYKYIYTDRISLVKQPK